VLGWNGTPGAGDIFTAFEDEREARDLANKRQALHREQEFRAAKAISLTDFYSQMAQGGATDLNLIIKGDVDGSVEALSGSLAKLATELKEGSTGSDYNQAALMMGRADAMAKGGVEGSAAMYRDSAALYEKFAAANKTSPDAPSALFNAAIAYDKAKDPKKAVAVREQLVKDYPEAKVLQQTYLLLGANLATSREYAASAKYNQEYLNRWPDSPQRCVAMQNLGVALQETKKPADAAAVYLRFANDPGCGAEDPNTTARVLYSAAKMQAEAKKTADAKKTMQALVALKGVTDPVAKSYQADAKDRLSKMK